MHSENFEMLTGMLSPAGSQMCAAPGCADPMLRLYVLYAKPNSHLYHRWFKLR